MFWTNTLYFLFQMYREISFSRKKMYDINPSGTGQPSDNKTVISIYRALLLTEKHLV